MTKKKRSILIVLILIELIANVVLGVFVCYRNETDFAIGVQSSKKEKEEKKVESLVRRRRSTLVFPKGSAFVTTLSILKAIMVKEPPNWNLIYEFDVIWPIPSGVDNFRKKFYKKPWLLKRRHRREIYNNFEMALNDQNLPGRQCVLRTICESATILNQPGLSLLEKALKVILGNSEEVEEIDSYDLAYRKGTNCNVEYPCPFSFLQLLLYSFYSEIVV